VVCAEGVRSGAGRAGEAAPGAVWPAGACAGPAPGAVGPPVCGAAGTAVVPPGAGAYAPVGAVGPPVSSGPAAGPAGGGVRCGFFGPRTQDPGPDGIAEGVPIGAPPPSSLGDRLLSIIWFPLV